MNLLHEVFEILGAEVGKRPKTGVSKGVESASAFLFEIGQKVKGYYGLHCLSRSFVIDMHIEVKGVIVCLDEAVEVSLRGLEVVSDVRKLKEVPLSFKVFVVLILL